METQPGTHHQQMQPQHFQFNSSFSPAVQQCQQPQQQQPLETVEYQEFSSAVSQSLQLDEFETTSPTS